MYYSGGKYYEGVSGDTVVGCYHIRFDTAYSDYSSAASAVSGYSDGFVKYYNGYFYGCIGSYISQAAASSAMNSRGISGGIIDSGTSATVTVVATNSGKILFEFDYGSSYYLGIRPISTGYKSQTWHKGYRYYGGFQFARLSGGSITVVNYVNVEDYVKGVLPYEMSSSWPREALKALACCARTYVMKNNTKHRSSGFDVCNTDDCQVYRGNNSANDNSDAAVDETAGKYITYNGSLCDTYYFSSDGGATENCENVWYATIPYLQGKVDPYEDYLDLDNKWSYTYTLSEITDILNNKGYTNSGIVSLSCKYTTAGNMYSITFTDSNGKTLTFSKSSAKSILSTSSKNVKSQHFTITGNGLGEINAYVNNSTDTVNVAGASAVNGSGDVSEINSNDVYVITDGGTSKLNSGSVGTGSGVYTLSGAGWGHNIGLSQYGAKAMAQLGYTYEDILKFYYTGVTVG